MEVVAISNVWQKTLVYFGLVEDELEDEELTEEEDYQSAQRELEESYRERSPNVRKLSRSSRKRRIDYDDIYAEDGGKVTRIKPLRSASPNNVRVHLVMPKNFNDAQQVADKLKTDVPVILNLQHADTDLSKRLIDFASGLTYALDGGMQRVADKVFMLTPRNVEVSAEEKARLLEKGFFNQS